MTTQNGGPRSSVTVDLGFLKWLYSEVRAYDTHYSTVRSGISTFLIGIMFLLTRGMVELTDDARIVNQGIVLIILLMNVLMIYLNLHFQRMTIACKKYQNEIEGLFVGLDLSNDTNNVTLSADMVRVREYTQQKFKTTDLVKAIAQDRPAQMVIMGSIIYWIVIASWIL